MENNAEIVDKYGHKKALTLENLNPNIIELEYVVRGPLYQRLIEIEKELQNGNKKPFNKIIKANIGDGQALGQVPITFIRQMVACVSYPELIKSSTLPEDVKKRTVKILEACGGNSAGSYSSSVGLEVIRRSVADYIEKRDGYKADWNNIYVSPGASACIKGCLQLLINDIHGKKTGVMVPVPEYPLYSATLVEYGLTQIDYYLDESQNWALTVDELDRVYREASKNCIVRALVVINPGNPTGQVISRESVEKIIKFAYKNALLILADEVYQHNIYDGEFHSFKKVLTEIGEPYNKVELVSLMSMSKGYMGECGFRGGWMELVNIDPEVQAHYFKCIHARLCPNIAGQVIVDCVARPPEEGEKSYELFMKEKNNILQSLKFRAKIVTEMFNNIEGISCNVVQGAMYAFPQIKLPPKAIEEAKSIGQEPDLFYTLKLLEETGICVLPGSGFGQKPGTYHFRTTILPETELLREMGVLFQKFHKKFLSKYL